MNIKVYCISVFILWLTSSLCAEDCDGTYVIDTQSSDQWQGRLIIKVPQDVNGWAVQVQFDAEVTSIDCSLATVTGSGTAWTLTSRGFDDELHAGTTFEMGVIVHFSGPSPNIISVDFNEDLLCEGGGEVTTASPGDGCGDDYAVDTEAEDHWQGRIIITVPEDVNGWTLQVKFDAAVTSIESSLATAAGSGTTWTLTSRGFDDVLESGTVFEMGIIVHFSGASPNIISMDFNENGLCDGGDVIPTTTSPGSGDCGDNYVIDTESADQWQGRIIITVPEDVNGWVVRVKFDAAVTSIESSLATAAGSGTTWTLTSRGFDDVLESGTVFEMGIIVHFSGASPNIISMDFNENGLCDGGDVIPTTTSPGSGDCGDNYVIDTESADQWQGRIIITVPEDVNGWVVRVKFDAAVTSIESSLATASGSGTTWTLTSRGFDDVLESGTVFEMGIIVHFSGASPSIISLDFNDFLFCEGGGEGTTTTDVTDNVCDDEEYEVETQAGDHWQGWVRLTVPEDISGWTLKIHFNTEVTGVDCALATTTGAGELWTLTSRGFDDDLAAGTLLQIGIIVHFSASAPFINNLIFNEDLICSGGNAPTTSVPTDPPTTATTTKTTTSTTTKSTTTTTHGHFDVRIRTISWTHNVTHSFH